MQDTKIQRKYSEAHAGSLSCLIRECPGGFLQQSTTEALCACVKSRRPQRPVLVQRSSAVGLPSQSPPSTTSTPRLLHMEGPARARQVTSRESVPTSKSSNSMSGRGPSREIRSARSFPTHFSNTFEKQKICKVEPTQPRSWTTNVTVKGTFPTSSLQTTFSPSAAHSNKRPPC